MTKLIGQADSFVWGLWMIILLLGTHLFMTFRTGFIQRKTIGTGIKLSLTKDTDSEGEVSPFGALSTALAATIGTGSIVGIGTAIALGGPGAVLWCWLTGVFGIATKYGESLLAVKYRVRTSDGRMQGGAMYVLRYGLKWKTFGKAAGMCFAVFAACASLGTGCATQVNAIATVAHENFHVPYIVVGVITAAATAIVIFGGIRSIASVCEKMVPFMALFYIAGCIVILCMNHHYLIPALKAVFRLAFARGSVAGGLVGGGVRYAMQYGVVRGLFSNESGLGSAPIAAAAARTRNPVRQALVSSTGTFWDTVVICALSGLVMVSTVIRHPGMTMGGTINGGILTSIVFSQIPILGPILLTLGLFAFAYSTILGWTYYGERAVEYIGGRRLLIPYRILYCGIACIAPVAELNVLWQISDILNALMAIPNLLALLLLSGVVVSETRKYINDIDAVDETPVPIVDK